MNERGYSLAELLVSMVIMLSVTGAIFSLVNPTQGASQAQPEVADLNQRMRVATDQLTKDLVMAGAGVYAGANSGSLANYFAPILPRRVGLENADDFTIARSDAISLAYVPNTYSQTTITSPMPNVSAELKVSAQPNCPQGEQLCGFKEGMAVIIFDTAGHFDPFTITQVQDAAGHLQHRGQQFSHSYDSGAQITQVEMHTYYFDDTNLQLRHYDGASTDLPVADNVVGLRFDYFGDAAPPTSPKPPAGVENCLYDNLGNLKGGLATLAPTDGSLAALPLAMFTDGPWCGAGSSQFDADLYRIRKVRVTLRLQAASDDFRGTNPSLFARPGRARGGERFIPDFNTVFDVVPRNLNLTR
jgi:hypothetical protein